MRENAAAKARRYLIEGRVIITAVRREAVMARVRGDGAVYDAGWMQGRWFCNCPAVRDCSHVRALRLVTAVDVQPHEGET